MKASNLHSVPDRKFAGASSRFVAALDWADRIAATSLPVYVSGETGTGKEALARRIHDRSPRADGAFVAVNCAALPDALLESELFGVCRGAFTGAEQDRPGLLRLADRGSLFLDEIGDMSAALQTRLLRVAQEGRVRAVGGVQEEAVDIRWICASHRILAQEVEAGRFRRDLFHRLCTLRVNLPPLRKRTGDLPILVDALAPRLHRETGLHLRLQPSALRVLESHPWPGNVRELHGVLAEALLRSDGGPVSAGHIALSAIATTSPTESGDELSRRQPKLPFDCDPGRPGLEQVMIESVLREERGNLTRAAERIGWSRGKLYRRLRFFGLER